MKEQQTYKQQLRALLTLRPNLHICKKVLDATEGLPVDYHGFSFGTVFEIETQEIFVVRNSRIDRVNLWAEISLFDAQGHHKYQNVTNCQFEFYVVKQDDYHFSDSWLLLDIDDLLFYLSRIQNEQAIINNHFPKLLSCKMDKIGFNFIKRGRDFHNQWFNKYSGPVFNDRYEDEFNELFAIASNGLAFLFRSRDRVMQEADLLNNRNYRSTLNLYPRFNNAIAEVAGTIYAAWERIAFLLNEFFPINPNNRMAPSFNRFITDKLKEANKDVRWQNAHLSWFENRINGPHAVLENLRHPTIHYNKHRSPSGTRAVELMKSTLDDSGIKNLKKTWDKELQFLKAELRTFDEALERAILLLETWAVI